MNSNNQPPKHFLVVGKYVFDKRLFRYGILIILSYIILLGTQYGFQNHKYAYCPVSNKEPCINPFYNIDCSENYCRDKTILPDSYVGEKPKELVIPFLAFSFGLLLLFLSINHLVYNIGNNIFKELNEHSSFIKFMRNAEVENGKDND